MKKLREIVTTYKKRKEFREDEALRRGLFQADFNFIRCGMYSEEKVQFDQSIERYNKFVDKYSDVLLPEEMAYYKNRAAEEFELLNSELIAILSEQNKKI